MHKITITIQDAEDNQDLLEKTREAVDLTEELLDGMEQPPPNAQFSQGSTHVSINQVFKE